MSHNNVENWEKTFKSLGFSVPSELALNLWKEYYGEEVLLSLLWLRPKCGIAFDFFALDSGNGFIEAFRSKGEYWVLTAPLLLTEGIESAKNKSSIRDFCNFLTSRLGLDKVDSIEELFIALDNTYAPSDLTEPVNPVKPEFKMGFLEFQVT